MTLHGLEKAGRDVRALTEEAMADLEALSVRDDFLTGLVQKLVSRKN